MENLITSSVRAVIVQDGKVLTLRRNFDDGVILWTFPGGHIEPFDKDEKEALKRECLEEINVQIKVGELIFTQNFKGEINRFYLCEIVKGKAKQGMGPEYLQPQNYHGTHRPQWLPIKDLKRFDLRPNELRDIILKQNNEQIS